MDFIGMFCAIIAVLITIAYFTCSKNFIGFIVGATVFVFIWFSFWCINYHFNPPIEPMDVYQGKTTLEYKVVDGVKVDSCVVWKEE